MLFICQYLWFYAFLSDIGQLIDHRNTNITNAIMFPYAWDKPVINHALYDTPICHGALYKYKHHGCYNIPTCFVVAPDTVQSLNQRKVPWPTCISYLNWPPRQHVSYCYSCWYLVAIHSSTMYLQKRVATWCIAECVCFCGVGKLTTKSAADIKHLFYYCGYCLIQIITFSFV